MATGWGLGGAALHHYAGWPRLRPEDFRLHSRYGRGLDWPLDYDDLRPWYDRIQREVGISGDSDNEETRPPGEPYPMPPLPRFRQARLLEKGFEALGLKTSAAPTAINSVSYHDRPACIYDGWCDAGCPTGALANPLVLHYRKAVDNEARFLTGCTVTRLHGDAGGRVGRYFNCHALFTTYGIMPEETDNHLGTSAGALGRPVPRVHHSFSANSLALRALEYSLDNWQALAEA